MFYDLNVRSDLTSAAAIREAATALFAERGFAAVTVRDIAASAGVSAPLVIHHYGSKDGLRRAVDAHVQHQLDELFTMATDPRLPESDEQSMMALFAEQLDALPTLVPYLRRLLVDGGEPAERLFTRLFEGTKAMLAEMQRHGTVAPSDDPDARAAFLLANDLGAVILREQLTAVLGVDPIRREGIPRWTRTLLDVYTHGVLRPPHEEEPA